MLGKLMKYDLRSSFRRFGPLWLALLVLAVINGFSMRGLFEAAASRGGFARLFFTVLPPMADFGVGVATAVLLIVFICERFYKGLLGDEGYLMFTLPASVSAHIGAKTLSSLILWVLSTVVAFASGLLLLIVYQPGALAEGWRELCRALAETQLPGAVVWLGLEALVLSLVGLVAEILKIYASIALGHLARRHRAFWSVMSYLGISLLMNFAMGFGLTSSAATRLLGRLNDMEWVMAYAEGNWMLQGLGAAACVGGAAILLELILGALYFFVTRLLLTKKLNLE